jgi:hypothetical protein
MGKYHCTVDLLFDCLGLVSFGNKNSFHTADSKPVKQEVNGTVILPPLVFPALYLPLSLSSFISLSPSLSFSLFLTGEEGERVAESAGVL